MGRQMTAEEMIKAIENMDVRERWKLLNELYFKYYNKEGGEYLPVDFDY